MSGNPSTSQDAAHQYQSDIQSMNTKLFKETQDQKAEIEQLKKEREDLKAKMDDEI